MWEAFQVVRYWFMLDINLPGLMHSHSSTMSIIDAGDSDILASTTA